MNQRRYVAIRKYFDWNENETKQQFVKMQLKQHLEENYSTIDGERSQFEGNGYINNNEHLKTFMYTFFIISQ